jgi:predicted RNA-binding Zn-ribbon protein involved in translation (DUF1610 family)
MKTTMTHFEKPTCSNLQVGLRQKSRCLLPLSSHGQNKPRPSVRRRIFPMQTSRKLSTKTTMTHFEKPACSTLQVGLGQKSRCLLPLSSHGQNKLRPSVRRRIFPMRTSRKLLYTKTTMTHFEKPACSTLQVGLRQKSRCLLPLSRHGHKPRPSVQRRIFRHQISTHE